MNEKVLHWKARLGKLKVLCGALFIGALFVTYRGISFLRIALTNPATPLAVTVADLSDGKIGTGRYIGVSGLALYELGYERNTGGQTTHAYYFLCDRDSGTMVLVRHPGHAVTFGGENEQVTLTGITRPTPADLQKAIEQDAMWFGQNGLRTTPRLYVEAGARPPTSSSAALLLVLGLGGVILCGSSLFLPRLVFVPYAVGKYERPKAHSPQKVTGTFHQLQNVDPPEFGQSARRCVNAVANAMPLNEHELLLYIHYILKIKTYGITVRTKATDWGVLLSSDRVTAITTGKLLGWKDQWAVRFQYPDTQEKMAALWIMFDDGEAQAAFVEQLRTLQFPVTTDGATA